MGNCSLSRLLSDLEQIGSTVQPLRPQFASEISHDLGFIDDYLGFSSIGDEHIEDQYKDEIERRIERVRLKFASLTTEL